MKDSARPKHDAEAMDATAAPRVLEELVQRAEKAGASDIHVQMREGGASICFRLDGVMTGVDELPNDLAGRVAGRIKFLARLKTYQESMPQDGRIARAEMHSENDIRVATYPTVTGEKIVLRLFQEGTGLTIEELGMAEEVTRELRGFLEQSSGLLLLTGPSGSGKTTTIYACLRHLAQAGGRHIITVEDPVEQIIPGVMQTEINDARGLTFAMAARHLLRQDPQILVLGEIRDDETASLAIRAALTGHVVIATLHAGSCRGVFERLFVMCRDHYAVISSIALVLNQRLIRRVCSGCKGAGCEQCLRTGYHGRAPVVEWVRVDESLREQLRTSGAQAVQPSRTLADSARQLCGGDITDLAECSRVFGSGVSGGT